MGRHGPPAPSRAARSRALLRQAGGGAARAPRTPGRRSPAGRRGNTEHLGDREEVAQQPLRAGQQQRPVRRERHGVRLRWHRGGHFPQRLRVTRGQSPYPPGVVIAGGQPRQEQAARRKARRQFVRGTPEGGGPVFLRQHARVRAVEGCCRPAQEDGRRCARHRRPQRAAPAPDPPGRPSRARAEPRRPVAGTRSGPPVRDRTAGTRRSSGPVPVGRKTVPWGWSAQLRLRLNPQV